MFAIYALSISFACFLYAHSFLYPVFIYIYMKDIYCSSDPDRLLYIKILPIFLILMHM